MLFNHLVKKSFIEFFFVIFIIIDDFYFYIVNLERKLYEIETWLPPNLHWNTFDPKDGV